MADSQPGVEQPIFTIAGEKVALGPLRRDLLPLYDRWFNDFEVGLRYFEQFRPQTREERQAWYERLAKGEPNTADFLIYERTTPRPIGKTQLYEIDHFNQTAAFGIIIGEKDCWGKGYGTETARLVLDYGFRLLGLHNIVLTVDANNERAVRAYRRAGFKEIGRRREARRRGNGVCDEVYMDCLATEFAEATPRSWRCGRTPPFPVDSTCGIWAPPASWSGGSMASARWQPLGIFGCRAQHDLDSHKEPLWIVSFISS